MKFIIRNFGPYDSDAKWVVVAQLKGVDKNTFTRIILNDLLKIDNNEFEQKIKDYKGIPYSIKTFACFRKKSEAELFINDYLIPQTIAAKLRGVKF